MTYQIKFSVEAASITDPAVLVKHFKHSQFHSQTETNISQRKFPSISSTTTGPKCYRCKKRGHVQKNCLNFPSTSSEIVPYNRANVRYICGSLKHTNHKFYKYIIIRDKCYVDFESECLLITPQAVKYFNLQPSKTQDNPLRLQTIRGIENDLICTKYVKTKIITNDV